MRSKIDVFETTRDSTQGGWDEYALIACSFLQVKKGPSNYLFSRLKKSYVKYTIKIILLLL